MLKFRDLLQGTPLMHRASVIIDEAQNTWLRDLGKNDFYHSKSIEKLLDRLVPDDIKKDQNIFDPGEIFLLLVSVYLHDIGRKTDALHHEIESYNEIKKNFRIFHLVNQFEGNAVAQICAAHAKEEVWPIQKCDCNYGIAALSITGKTFNLQRLGALLRIADELDNTYVRVNGLAREQDSIRNLIRDVNPIPKKGMIEIQAEYETWEERELILGVADYTQSRIREVSKYLRDLDLDYYQVWLKEIDFVAPLSISPSSTYNSDLVESVGILAESKFTNVELFKKLGDCEISVFCEEILFGGIKSISALIVVDSLNKSKALEYRGALSYLREQKEINNGIVITEKPTKKEITEIITSQNFVVITFSQLINDLINFNPLLNKFIKFYEEKDIFTKNLYIDLNALEEDGTTISNIDEYIQNWLNDDGAIQTTILGDFGSGKTTFCEKLNYVLTQKFLSGSCERIPLYIPLKNIGSISSIEAALTDYFVNENSIDINYKTFESMNKAGKFVLILDGFDEMPRPVNEKNVLRAFKEIDKLVTKKSKVVLSCRTHFFKSTSEIHKVHNTSILYESVKNKFGYKLIFLQPLNNSQISQYLERWDNKLSGLHKNKIETIYNLHDLATRPVLLNIIVKTLPQLETGVETEINAASLYRLYIKFWLERDDWRSELDSTERKILAEKTSEYIFTNDITEIHFSLLSSLLKKWTNGVTEYDFESMEYELRTCNFLKNDQDGNFSFVHKSFMEYLLAELIINSIFCNNRLNLIWFLPLENPSKNSGKIVNIEVQDFYIQLFRIKLLELSENKIELFIKNDNRKQSIFINSMLLFEHYSHEHLFLNILLNKTSKADKAKLAQIVSNSTKVHELFNSLIEELKYNDDLDFVVEIFDILSSVENDITSIYLEQLDEIIQQKEMEHDKKGVFDKNLPKNYPFTKENRRLKLNKAIGNLNDEIEIMEVKRTFYRDWERKKAEFDQQEKKHEQIAKNIEKEAFNSISKNKRKK